MRRQDTPLAELLQRSAVGGQRVQSVGVQHGRHPNAAQEVVDQTPGRAVTAEPGTDHGRRGALQVPQHDVLGGMADVAGGNLGYRRRHHLGALGGQNRVDPVGDQEPDKARPRARGRGGGQVGGAGQAQRSGQHDHRAEGPLVPVLRPRRHGHRLGRLGQPGPLGHLQAGGGDRDLRLVGDADLHRSSPGVAADQAHPGRAGVRGQDLDPAPREADAGAVEALDHGFLGRPAARQTLG